MATHRRKISDLTVEHESDVLILEQRDSRQKLRGRRRIVHLSGVTMHRDWRMRLSELKLVFEYGKRSFYSLTRGRIQPLDLTTGPKSRAGEGRASGSNSTTYWIAKPAFNLAGLFLIFVILINVTFALNSGTNMAHRVVASSRDGVSALTDAQDAILGLDFARAAEAFTEAELSFTAASAELEDVSRSVHLLSKSPLAAGDYLLKTGERLAFAGTQMTKALDVFEESFDLDAALIPFEEGLKALTEAEDSLSRVDTSVLPTEIRSEVRSATSLLRDSRKKLDTIHSYVPTVRNVLGYDKPKKYLVMFQNTTEKRGSGGFLGAFATITVEHGSLTSMQPEDVYRVDWCMVDGATLPEAPDGLKERINEFHLRDANYSPDFPTTAKWIQWFYENTCTGSEVDGVIAIDETILQSVLRITGPVTLDEYGVTLTSDNFFEVLEFYIETNKELSRTVIDGGGYGTPKQILVDLVPIITERVVDPKYREALFSMALEKIEKRHVQAYFDDADAEKFAETLGLDGALYEEERVDFLHVSHMNIAGNKSDRYIDEVITHDTNVTKDGVMTDTVTIRRTHTFDEQSLRELHRRAPQIIYESADAEERGKVEFVLGNGPNNTFTRVFVPRHSVLMRADGISTSDIATSEEVGKEVFGFTWELKPGETKEVQLTYVLPYSLDLDATDIYRLVVQKQAGDVGTTLHKTMDVEQGVIFALEYPGQTSGDDEIISHETNLDRDRYFMHVLEHS